jgi:anti-sigma28 factor (negative regulator of flagellin synthesis)
VTLRIDDPRTTAGLAPSHQLQESAAVRRYGDFSAGFANSEASDRVELSSLADRISAAFELQGSANEARIGRLRALFQSGEYRVDAEAIGRSLITETVADR